MMRKILLLVFIVSSSASSLPSNAGQKCSQSVETCFSTMSEKLAAKGWVGIELEPVADGLKILRIIPGSPAEDADLRTGDTIVALNGISYGESDRAALESCYAREMKVGKTVQYTIERNGERAEIAVELGSVPEEVAARWIGQHLLSFHSVRKPE